MKYLRRGLLFALAAVFTLAIALFAAACGNSVKLSFSSNGKIVETRSVEKGSTVELPQLIWEGEGHYVFDGWNTQSDLEGRTYTNTITAPEENTTYYAVWAEAYELTLNLDGGSLAGETTLWLKEGANIYEVVKDLIPVREGLTFGAWFAGGEPLSESRAMSARSLTLTAAYKVSYTVEYHLQNLQQSDWDVERTLTETGSDYIGTAISPTGNTPAGFTFNAARSEGITLTANASSNVLKLYYDRASYEVRYNAELPDGVSYTGSIASVSVIHGGKIKVAENAFEAAGYRFSHWRRNNSNEIIRPGDELEVNGGGVILYAVWDRGYTNRLGGGDYIYFPQLDAELALLARGGVEFTGVRDGDDFVFEATPALKGRVYGNTFVYFNENISGTYVAIAFNAANNPALSEEEVVDRASTLVITNYLTATFTGTDELGEKLTLVGLVSFDESFGDYRFEITEGSYAGAVLHFDLGVYRPQNGEEVKGFSFRGSEADEERGFYQAIPHGDGAFVGGYIVLFNGYGQLALYETTYGSLYYGSYYIGEVYYQVGGEEFYTVTAQIADDYGELSGYIGNVVRLEFYAVKSVGDDLSYFVLTDGTKGDYRGEGELGGDTLSLDGFGIFPGSAVWMRNGKAVLGSYFVEESSVFGPVLYFYEMIVDAETGYVKLGETYLFYLSGIYSDNSADKIFGEYVKPDDRRFDAEEYYLFVYAFDEASGTFSPALSDPLTYLLLEADENGLSRAELWVENEKGVAELAASGTFSMGVYGTGHTVTYYTFTATQAQGAYAGLESFTFLTNMTTPDGATFLDVFYLLEYNGEARYTVRTEVSGNAPNGGVLWDTPLNLGMGSIYFAPDGNAYEGSFEYFTSEYFGYSLGNFTWIDFTESSYNVIEFEIFPAADGGFTFAASSGLAEIPVYTFEEGVLNTMVTLIVDGVSAAYYNGGDGVDMGGTTYTYEPTGEVTDSGVVYRLTQRGRPTGVTFVLYEYYYAPEDVTILCYCLFDEAGAGEYAAEGGTLTLDGFTHGVYKTVDGREIYGSYYFASLDGVKALYFTATDGTAYYFRAEGKTLLPLDTAYGEWEVYLGGGRYLTTVFFDGNGVITANGRGIGTYRVIPNDEYLLCAIVADFGGGEKSYLATFTVEYGPEGTIFYTCTLLDENAYGIYTAVDLSVLALDGYGYATYYAPDGSAGVTGYFELIDDETHFARVSFGWDGELHVSYDPASGNFYVLDYSKYDYVYYTPDFSVIAFDATGIVTVGNRAGEYDVRENSITAYMLDMETLGYEKIENLPLPTGADTYDYEGVTYYLFKGEEEVVFEGCIVFLDKDGEPLSGVSSVENATLTFTVDGEPWIAAEAVLEAEGKSYRFTFTYEYYGMITGTPGPHLYDENYNYYPVEIEYIPGRTHTFVGIGSEGVQTEFYDGYQYDSYYSGSGNWDPEKISLLQTVYVGFGPIRRSEPVLRGTLYYDFENWDDPESVPENAFEFTADPDGVQVISASSSAGNLNLIVFEKDGRTYAMSYYAYGGRFELYMFMSYETVSAGKYTVGVGKFLYANSYAFGSLYSAGDFCAAVLFENGVAVSAFDHAANSDGTAWQIAMGGYDVSTGEGELGGAYWIEVDFAGGNAVSATVKEYGWKQALSDDARYFFNFFLDENGEIVLLATVGYNSGDGYGYLFLRFTAGENADGSWTFRTEDGEYTVLFDKDEHGNVNTYDENGNLVEDGTGEFWMVYVS